MLSNYNCKIFEKQKIVDRIIWIVIIKFVFFKFSLKQIDHKFEERKIENVHVLG